MARPEVDEVRFGEGASRLRGSGAPLTIAALMSLEAVAFAESGCGPRVGWVEPALPYPSNGAC